ncbi:MAG: LytR/AlgR family response regulator transcription factor [Tenacibaculum sp.]
MKAVIIEDEKPAARRLKRMLVNLKIEPSQMLHSVGEATNWFSQNKHPDLLFLDIQLSDGLCFEIFEKVLVKSAVIFTTAYHQYALKAFKLNSVDYLLKPIDKDELKVAVTKFQHCYPNRTDLRVNIDDIRKLLTNSVERKFKKRFSVKVGQYIKIVQTDEIECFYSENKASYIYSKNKRNYLIDKSLDYWYDQLNTAQFFRVNRSFIVNISAIKAIFSHSNSRLQLKLNNYSDIQIIVSRERVKDFKCWIE